MENISPNVKRLVAMGLLVFLFITIFLSWIAVPFLGGLSVSQYGYGMGNLGLTGAAIFAYIFFIAMMLTIVLSLVMSLLNRKSYGLYQLAATVVEFIFTIILVIICNSQSGYSVFAMTAWPFLALVFSAGAFWLLRSYDKDLEAGGAAGSADIRSSIDDGISKFAAAAGRGINAAKGAFGKPWTCPQCGTACASGADFCPQCGAKHPEPRRCPSCGAPVPDGAAFCQKCGAKYEVVSFCPSCGKKLVNGEVCTCADGTPAE